MKLKLTLINPTLVVDYKDIEDWKENTYFISILLKSKKGNSYK